jgi:hypothetical protein
VERWRLLPEVNQGRLLMIDDDWCVVRCAFCGDDETTRPKMMMWHPTNKVT